MFKKLGGKLVAGAVGAVVAGSAMATSIVDYSGLGTAVTTELTAGVAAAVSAVGIIWGARIGLRFVRSIMH